MKVTIETDESRARDLLNGESAMLFVESFSQWLIDGGREASAAEIRASWTEFAAIYGMKPL